MVSYLVHNWAAGVQLAKIEFYLNYKIMASVWKELPVQCSTYYTQTALTQVRRGAVFSDWIDVLFDVTLRWDPVNGTVFMLSFPSVPFMLANYVY